MTRCLYPVKADALNYEGDFPRVRLIDHIPDLLTPEIFPDVGNSTK